MRAAATILITGTATVPVTPVSKLIAAMRSTGDGGLFAPVMIVVASPYACFVSLRSYVCPYLARNYMVRNCCTSGQHRSNPNYISAYFTVKIGSLRRVKSQMISV
jgi:hypothetical protein